MIAALSTFEWTFWLAACLLFVFMSGLFSGAETGLYCLNQTRLRLAAHDRDPAALRLQKLFVDRGGLLFTALLGTNLANYLAPICLTVVFLNVLNAETRAETEHLAELYTTLILTPTVFIFGEVVPKNLFQRDADRLMGRVSTILRVTHRLFQSTGILGLQRRFSKFVLRRLHRPGPVGPAFHSRLDVYQMLRDSAADGTLSGTQSTILERIHLLESIRVGGVMVPQGRVVMLPADRTAGRVERTLRRTRFSRMPLFRDNRRNVVGVVHLLDILTAPADRTLQALAHPPIRIGADVHVIDALDILQREHRRMAIVVDKAGRCVGIVTVKDLVEEIVGELAAW